MMDNEEGWVYDHDEARVKTDLTTVLDFIVFKD